MSKKEVNVIGKDGEIVDTLSYIPIPFLFEYRYDLIKRAVLTELQNEKQSKGVNKLAGKRTTAESWGVGYGIARVPRVKGSGYPRAAQAAFIPSAKGGYNPTAPKSNKVIRVKMNKKEKKIALFSAIACTSKLDMLIKRGHRITNANINLPIVVSQEVSNISKTKDLISFLKKIGIYEDIIKVKETVKIRAGKGKLRGRKYKERKGPLIVTLNHEPIKIAAKNLAGIEVINVSNIKVKDLAPGCLPGRLTVWTIKAYKYLAEKYGYEGELK